MGLEGLINACMDYRHIKTFSKRTKLSKAAYENVVARWQEFGSRAAPAISVFEDKTTARISRSLTCTRRRKADVDYTDESAAFDPAACFAAIARAQRLPVFQPIFAQLKSC